MDHVELTAHRHRLAGSLLADIEFGGGKCLAQPGNLVQAKIDHHVDVVRIARFAIDSAR